MASGSGAVDLSRSRARRTEGNDTSGQMVEQLKRGGHITSAGVARAMCAVDRAAFALVNPYVVNAVCWLAHNRYMCAPIVYAKVLECIASRVYNAGAVCVVGAGCGYLTMLIAVMSGAACKIIGIEPSTQLCAKARETIQRIGYGRMLESKHMSIECADAQLGWPTAAPYQCIVVDACVTTVPASLIEQLGIGGRLLYATSTAPRQYAFFKMDKFVDGSCSITKLCDVPHNMDKLPLV